MMKGTFTSPGPLSRALRSLRVLYFGKTIKEWLGDQVNLVEVAATWTPDRDAENWVDIIVVTNCQQAYGCKDITTLISEAKTAGIRTIGFLYDKSDLELGPLVDVTVSPIGKFADIADIALPPLVDLRKFSPVGNRKLTPGSPLLAMQSRRKRNRRRTIHFFERLMEVGGLDKDGEWLFSLGELDSNLSIANVLSDLRQAQGVLDHACLHESLSIRVNYLAQLAVSRIPFLLLDEQRNLVDPALGIALRSSTSMPLETLLDSEKRQRHSVSQCRIGLRRFTDFDRWNEIATRLNISIQMKPTVSVLLTTKRPDKLEHALNQIQNQTYEPIEIVLVLHGDSFGVDELAQIESRAPNAVVLRLSGDISFGDALNAGVESASGELITKMDDDDWYGSDHLWDLVYAMEYSSADMVGKFAEWVYLRELDITIRRGDAGAEMLNSTSLAGGTLMLRRADLRSIGGFRRAQRHIDWGLIRDLLDHGGSTYRTHGFGYLLNRESQGHTWEVGVDYFLDNSTEQIRGLALDASLTQHQHEVQESQSGDQV